MSFFLSCWGSEGGGGDGGLAVNNDLKQNIAELRSCVKVKVAILGSRP